MLTRYFVLFDAFVNGIVFIISFHDCSLIVYGNAIDFCVLTVSWYFAEFVVVTDFYGIVWVYCI